MMLLRRFCHALVFVLSSWALPAAAQLPARTPGSMVGCYRVEVGEWKPPAGMSGKHLPLLVQLDTVEDGTPWQNHEYRGLYGVKTLGPEPSGWGLFGGDSIRISWSNGFSGFGIVGRVRGDSVHGQVHEFTDILGTTYPTASIVAVRVACLKG